MRTTAFTLILLFLAQPTLAEPHVTVDQSDDGLISVVADDLVAATADVVWETLTDYDHIAQFIPDMLSSRVISTADEPLRVAQQGTAGFLLYHFQLDVTLEIYCDPQRQVSFHSIAGNMRDMDGFYLLEEAADGHTHLHYETHFRPDFWVPALIGPLVMKIGITRQFEGLAAEIMRRSNTRHPANSSTPGH